MSIQDTCIDLSELRSLLEGPSYCGPCESASPSSAPSSSPTYEQLCPQEDCAKGQGYVCEVTDVVIGGSVVNTRIKDKCIDLSQLRALLEGKSYCGPCVSASPSSSPSASPTATPSASPTRAPSASPSSVPSVAPSASPSSAPSVAPSASPSSVPSAAPTGSPTEIDLGDIPVPEDQGDPDLPDDCYDSDDSSSFRYYGKKSSKSGGKKDSYGKKGSSSKKSRCSSKSGSKKSSKKNGSSSGKKYSNDGVSSGKKSYGSDSGSSSKKSYGSDSGSSGKKSSGSTGKKNSTYGKGKGGVGKGKGGTTGKGGTSGKGGTAGKGGAGKGKGGTSGKGKGGTSRSSKSTKSGAGPSMTTIQGDLFISFPSDSGDNLRRKLVVTPDEEELTDLVSVHIETTFPGSTVNEIDVTEVSQLEEDGVTVVRYSITALVSLATGTSPADVTIEVLFSGENGDAFLQLLSTAEDPTLASATEVSLTQPIPTSQPTGSPSAGPTDAPTTLAPSDLPSSAPSTAR